MNNRLILEQHPPHQKKEKWTDERNRSVVRGGEEVWQNGPRGTSPHWYLNTNAEQNCCYHKKLMNEVSGRSAEGGWVVNLLRG